MVEWETFPLGDVARLKMGQSPPGSLVTDLNAGLPFLQGNAEFGVHCPKATLQCDEAVRRSAPGDSLISVRAPVGATNRADRAYGIGRGLAAVTFDLVGSDFGHHALVQRSRDLQRVSQGTTFSAVGRTELASLQLPVPPLDEQRRIAEILDTIDETIHATERVITKLVDVERGLRHDLLSGSLEDALFEDWTRRRIGDFADVQRGASPRPIDNPAWFAMDGPGWIRISDVTAAGDLLLQTRDHLSPAGVARSRRAFPGDVIMSIAATIGVAIVVGIEACYHDGFVRIDHDASVISEFLVMLLEHHKEDFLRSGQTGTQANINSEIVAATEVALPSLEVQSEIVSATSSARDAIRAERESHRALLETRAGLAADLLSGRVRTVAA